MYVLRIALFLAIVLVVVVGGHVYLYRRLFRDTTSDRRIRRVGAIALAFAGASLFLARSVFVRFHTPWGDALAFAAWCWMGIGLYLGMSLAAFHLWRRMDGWRRSRTGAVPVSPARRQFLARAAVGGAGLVAAGFSAYGVRRAFAPPVIDEVAVRLPRLHRAFDGLRLVQVSDVHIGDVLGRPFLEDMVQRCNALKPDLVAVTGDLVDGHVDRLAPTIAALQRLRSRWGTYFVTGNHEYYSGDVEWCAALERMGLTVLRNRIVTLRDGDARLDLVGVDDYGQKDRPAAGTWTQRWPDATPSSRRSCWPTSRAVEDGLEKGIGLQLSGHTHGGQMFPITGLVAALWTYSAGLYRVGDAHVYVHRGTGFWGPPMRIGSPPEIAAITLTA
jgi:predicted MPP superfamily phosphohydrolase